MATIGKGTRYYSEEKTRHGKLVVYYRRPRFPKIKLDATPNTAAMDRAYHAAEKLTNQRAADKAAGVVVANDRPMRVCTPTKRPEYVRQFGDTAAPGVERSLRWALAWDQASPYFNKMKRRTRSTVSNLYRQIVALRNDAGKAYGDWDIDQMDSSHVSAIQQKLKDRPATADGAVRNLKAMFYRLQRADLFSGVNPAKGVTWLHPYNDDNDGWPQWDSEALDKYERRHALHTPARMALGLILYAGKRMGDVATSGPHEFANGKRAFHWIEGKGKDSQIEGKHRPENKSRKLVVAPELREIIEAQKVRHPRAFVVKLDGQPYAQRGLEDAFKVWCRQAGLEPQYSAHGARKLAAAMMYEGGMNEAQLCAIFGWRIGSRMAAWYAKNFDKARAQEAAFAALRRARAAA
jgi:integrase